MPTLKLLKGPKHIPILGWRYRGLQMLKDPAQFFVNLQAKYGDFCCWDPKNPKQLCAFGPTLNKYVFTQPDIFIVDAFRESNLPRNSAIERLSFGLMRLNGEEHKKHRQLMQPAFRTAAVDMHFKTIIEETQKTLVKWQYGEIRKVDIDIMHIIANVSFKTMFGVENSNETDVLHEKMKQLLKLATNPLNLLLPFNVPLLPYRKMLKIADQIEEVVKKIIYEKNTEGKHDILSILLNSCTDQNEKLSEKELIAEAYTALCHESVAASLTWTILLLERHPKIYKELLDEIANIFQGDIPTLEKLDQAKFLDNIIKESIRLLPPSGFSLRYLNCDHEYNGIMMKKDSMLFLSSYVTHRNPEIYENPLDFNPYRWDSIKPSPYEYLPFGCGTHSCMGKYFALLEMKIILILIIQKFNFRIPAKFKVDRGMRVSMVPKHGLLVKLLTPNVNSAINPIKGNIGQSVNL